jgi:hypothetical protein
MKKRRTRDAAPMSNSNDDRFLIDVARLSTSLAAQLRSVSACIQTVILLPANIPLAQALLEAGREYNQQRSSGGFQSAGPPNIFIWRALIMQISKCKLNEQEAAIVKQHVDSATSPEFLQPFVKMCKASLTFDKQKVKLIFAVADELRPLRDVLLCVLQRLEGIPKYGPSAKSSFERQVLRHLQKRGVFSQPGSVDMPAIMPADEQMG